MSPVTPNKKTVADYMEAFRRTDRERILACLTDDVVWEIPGMFHVQGKDAFAGHIVDDGFKDKPDITVTRMVEEDDVVVAEGRVRAPRADGGVMHLAFCDVFEMRGGLIRRLVSYLAEVKAPETT